MLRELKDREKQRKQSQNINKEIENLKKKQILELKSTKQKRNSQRHV